MEQELARSLGNVVHPVGLQVLGDVAAEQPDLVAVDLGIGIFEVRLAVAQALDLGAGQDEARLDLLQQLVIVPRAAVAGDDLDAGFVGLGPLLSLCRRLSWPSRIPETLQAAILSACSQMSRV